jgi:hypothetical protein
MEPVSQSYSACVCCASLTAAGAAGTHELDASEKNCGVDRLAQLMLACALHGEAVGRAKGTL